MKLINAMVAPASLLLVAGLTVWHSAMNPHAAAAGLAPLDTETVPELADRALVERLLKLPNQVPPLLSDGHPKPLRFQDLPRYARKKLLPYTNEGLPSDLRDLVEKAVRVLINANQAFGDTMPLLPANQQEKNQVIAGIVKRQEDLAVAYLNLAGCYEELKTVEKQREKETAQWKASYDYVMARLLFRMAHVYEYQVMLGKVRKEDLPAADPKIHQGYRLVPREKLGDFEAEQLAKQARKILERLAEENKGTPWELIAKRDLRAKLGLEWKAY